MKYLESKEGIGNGELVLKGTRIKVARVMRMMLDGYTIEQMQEWWPWLSTRKLRGQWKKR